MSTSKNSESHRSSAERRRTILNIVITGGHHNSALVVARELIAQGHTVEWIGHRRAAVGDTRDSAEYIEVKEANIPFHELKAGKSSLRLDNLFNIPLGIYRAQKMLHHIRPDCIISFGGYLGLAVSAAASLEHIPVYIHEQTSVAGKANKLVARFARHIFVTWPSSLSYFPAAKTQVVGLPLRPSFLAPTKKKLFARNKPTIFVLCGKQGSHVINKLIFAHLNDLLANYNIIHQTGTSSATGDYEKAVSLKESLVEEISEGYKPYGYIAENDTALFMANSDIVLGRSGAHTTYELGIMGKKCLLIPLMSTHGHEQLHLARILEKAGLASILTQSDLSYPKLDNAIRKLLTVKEVSALPLERDAAHTMIGEIKNDLIRG